MSELTREQFKKWGAEGGRKSKRKLTPAQARAMVAAREAKRAKQNRMVETWNTRIE